MRRDAALSYHGPDGASERGSSTSGLQLTVEVTEITESETTDERELL